VSRFGSDRWPGERRQQGSRFAPAGFVDPSMLSMSLSLNLLRRERGSARLCSCGTPAPGIRKAEEAQVAVFYLG